MLSRLFCCSIFLLKPICAALLLPKPSCSKSSRFLTSMSSREPNSLLRQAISWSATNGLIYTDGAYVWGHAPLSLLPNSFPRESFEYMKNIQPIFSTLIDKVSRDKDFIMSTLYQAAQSDDFMRRLLKIYDNLPRKTVTESINLGIHRSDYMLQQDDQPDGVANKVLQVEINTIASSFGCLSSKVGKLSMI
jgi:glutathione synthase